MPFCLTQSRELFQHQSFCHSAWDSQRLCCVQHTKQTSTRTSTGTNTNQSINQSMLHQHQHQHQHPHPSTPAPQHPSTPAPQHPSTPAPQHPSTVQGYRLPAYALRWVACCTLHNSPLPPAYRKQCPIVNVLQQPHWPTWVLRSLSKSVLPAEGHNLQPHPRREGRFGHKLLQHAQHLTVLYNAIIDVMFVVQTKKTSFLHVKWTTFLSFCISRKTSYDRLAKQGMSTSGCLRLRLSTVFLDIRRGLGH
jgi:hypothetical protein